MVVFWHGEMIFQPFLYKKIQSNPNGRVIISRHADGKIAAKIIKFFGLKTIRGSTSKGAVSVLISAFRFLKKGEDLAITPDGPRGPYHSIADGIINIAQKSATPIIVFRLFAHDAWQLNSWDKFIIPKPFSHIYCVASEPIQISEKNKEKAKMYLKQKMEAPLESYEKN